MSPNVWSLWHTINAAPHATSYLAEIPTKMASCVFEAPITHRCAQMASSSSSMASIGEHLRTPEQ